MPVTPLSELPEGWPVVVDTETSKAHPDDAGAAVSVVSFAYWDPQDQTRMVSQAVPFDQGLNPEGLPLGPKALPKATQKRVAKWPDWAREEVTPNRPPEDFDRLLALLERCTLDFHHAKFDLAFLEHGLRGHRGRNLQDRLGWDTMLGQMVLDPMMPKALKHTAVRLELTDSGAEDAEAEALKPWLGPKSGKNADPRYDLVPWSVMEPYARVDAELTLLLKRHQERRLDPEVDEDLYRFIATEHALTHVLVNMGRRGVGFDAERCREAAKVLRAELDEAAAALPFKGSTGRPTPNAARAFFFAEGVRAPYPDKMTKGGKNSPPQPQVDEEVIARLVAEGAPFAAEYERHEGLKSALSKWYEPWAAACGSDGRLRAAFRQGGAVSGRLAAGRVNLLAIPHDRLMPSTAVPSVRQLIVPKPGHELWEFDVSQAEIRVATAVTRCKAMLEGLQRGEDSHATTCKNMFGIDEDDPDWAWMRKVAKACNLGILYGEGARTLQAQIAKATGTKYKLGEVSGWIKDWKAALPEFAEGLEIAERQAERHGYVRLYNGRRRYFADYEPAYKAFNQIVQGSLAEMMKLIMIEADATWPGELVLQVHDSLVMEIPEAEVETRRGEVPALMKRRFERAIWVPWEPGGDPVTVPYETDAKRWGEAD